MVVSVRAELRSRASPARIAPAEPTHAVEESRHGPSHSRPSAVVVEGTLAVLDVGDNELDDVLPGPLHVVVVVRGALAVGSSTDDQRGVTTLWWVSFV